MSYAYAWGISFKKKENVTGKIVLSTLSFYKKVVNSWGVKDILVNKELIFNNCVKIVINMGFKSEKILNAIVAKNFILNKFILKTVQGMVLPKLSIK